MKRREMLAGGAAALATGLARPSLAQGARVLKYVPQADLANPDPIWTTTIIAAEHGYMVWDTLYGLDEGLVGPAADGRRARRVQRRADLDLHAARRAAVSRRRARARE